MERREFLLAAAALPFDLPEGERLRPTGRVQGWTVLRDREAPRGAAETGMVLVRVQRPVAPGNRPGHLAATLRAFRPFHFSSLPAAEAMTAAGLPGAAIEARGMGIGSRAPVMVRAVCLYGAARSYLIIASAPVGEWAAIRPEAVRLVERFRPMEQ